MIMNFCVLRTEKIKSAGQMSARFNHDYRIADVKNADPNLKELNESYIKPAENKTYTDAFNDTINNLEYYQTHNVRSNAVQAIDVMTALPPDAECDVDEWKQANAKWIQDYFNVGGRNNVISLVYHMDEGNIHCHAMVVPIDENGKLNARRFLGGSKAMSDMQTSYAEAMKDLGLQRGVKGSSARHNDIRRYYAELNEAISNIPKPLENESAIDYRERMLESLGTARAANLRAINEMKVRQQQQVDYERMLARHNIKQEIDEERTQAKQELIGIQAEYDETFRRLAMIQRQLELTEKELQEKEGKYKTLEAEHSVTNSKVEFYDNFHSLMQQESVTKSSLYDEMKHILAEMEQMANESIERESHDEIAIEEQEFDLE